MSKNVFFIPGMQKCGTSSLHASLIAHPEIHPATSPETGETIKELHYFADYGFEKGEDWFDSHFNDGELSLDATPNYTSTTSAMKRLAEYKPDAKFVVSLREPVARCVSQHNHYCDTSIDTSNWDWRVYRASLRENIEAELANPFDEWQGFISRGFYAQQLTAFFRFFPRENVHIMIMEEWADRPDEAFRTLIEFLEVEPYDLPVAHLNRRAYKPDQVADEVLEMLEQFYEQPNRQLFELLGREIPSWNRQ